MIQENVFTFKKRQYFEKTQFDTSGIQGKFRSCR